MSYIHPPERKREKTVHKSTHRFTQACTHKYGYISICTGIHKYRHKYRDIHGNTQVYTGKQLYTSKQVYTQVDTIIHGHTRIYTGRHIPANMGIHKYT